MPIALEEALRRVAVVTADMSHEQVDRSVREVLKLMREHLKMDVAFVSHFEQGRRVYQQVDAADSRWLPWEGKWDALERSFCQRVIDGRLPQLITDVTKLPNYAELPHTPAPIGAHLSVPIVLPDGRIYGTLCCFSLAPNEALTQRDLKRLQMATDMTARLVAKNSRRDDDNEDGDQPQAADS
ncbi:GAF domain-containing protein [Variovorax sp. ZT4R33]|uniref:GAF domain-containing protein n=1 Tax=Variovorax sp. ZT4R33 TaxID=3443743 RepID=UPI003F448AC8